MPKSKVQKTIQNVQAILTRRRCPFCRAVNLSERKRCRKCFLALPQYANLKGKGSDKLFWIPMKDPRSSLMRLADYIEVLAVIIPGIVFLLDRLYRKSTSIPWQHYTPAIVALTTVTLYYVSSNQSIETMCRNCGQTIVIKIPVRKQSFPQAVRCWACGAVHQIQWDFQKDKSLTLMAR